MSQKPQKTRVGQPPATRAEITWIVVLLVLCLMAHAWLAALVPESSDYTPVQATVPIAAPAPTVVQTLPERPARERPLIHRERPWRDPSSLSMPGF